MAEKFTLDAAEAESGLSTADAATAAQPSSNLPGLCIGGYMTTLLGAVVGGRAIGQAQAEVA